MGINKSGLSLFQRLGFAHGVAENPLEAWFSYRSSEDICGDLEHMIPQKFFGRIPEFAHLYGLYAGAMDELRRRAEFFITLLDGPGSVSPELLEEVGAERLGIRAAVALHLAF